LACGGKDVGFWWFVVLGFDSGGGSGVWFCPIWFVVVLMEVCN